MNKPDERIIFNWLPFFDHVQSKVKIEKDKQYVEKRRKNHSEINFISSIIERYKKIRNRIEIENIYQVQNLSKK
jgi:uncharacterized protein (UPF0305 family)